MNKPKETSNAYGLKYQTKQANKYRQRNNNHWKHRIKLAQDLVEKYVNPKFSHMSKNDIVVVDIGCSIGSFAIEFKKLGYQSYGIDFDKDAIDIAKELAKEEHVEPEFVCGDVSTWSENFPKIDIALCFDIFEHLHDDELGAFLSKIITNFSENGMLVFHTYPMQYDYIFYHDKYTKYPLIPFKNINPNIFNKFLKIYSSLYDIYSIIRFGKTHAESIKLDTHCNPLTLERLSDIFNRNGYDITYIDTSNLYNFKPSIQQQFKKQPFSHRNLYGVCIPKK